MLSLKGDNIYLRAIESKDLDFLYELENDTNLWEISGTVAPYSRQVLSLYLDNAHRDIYDVKQLRLCICNIKTDKVLGLIDLFDFDPKNNRAGVGIVVLKDVDKNKGIGFESLELLCNYTKNVLGLKQLYANVLENNTASIHLFKKLGFERVGVKKDWIYSNGAYKNEILFQKINT